MKFKQFEEEVEGQKTGKRKIEISSLRSQMISFNVKRLDVLQLVSEDDIYSLRGAWKCLVIMD